jgi:EAL domain-containing protein (putative c-di-GMP-specific phosphodiesterase class I)
VSGARHNHLIRPMLDSSISIAKRLSMQSVAEGVETEDDWHLMRELECDFAQGYFIGRPMASDRVGEWHEQWLARNADLLEQWN